MEIEIDIEKEKEKILKNIEILEEDIKILQNNILEFKVRLLDVETKEDAEKFCSEIDLENGLKSIQLF